MPDAATPEPPTPAPSPAGMPPVAPSGDVLTVHQLRSRWKPAKQRLLAAVEGHATHVRFHRACSWMQRVEQMLAKASEPGEGPGPDLDVVLALRWVAFNALYGQWDADRGDPLPDRACWRDFLKRLGQLDAAGNGHIPAMIDRKRDLVYAVLDDAHIARFFWRQGPDQQQPGRTTRERRDAPLHLAEGRWPTVLDQAVDRIYVLRCQLIHGAATHNSRLNRKTLERCVDLAGEVLNAVMLAWIDHAEEQDWGEMCYPPMGD